MASLRVSKVQKQGVRNSMRKGRCFPVRTTAVREGETAPDITLKDQTGKEVSLSSLRSGPFGLPVGGKKYQIVYFFPQADTPGCTQESCSFRDQYTVFEKAGCSVVGISNGSPEAHKQWAEKYNLPFTILSDEGDQARKKFGVKNDFFFLPGRETFVLDSDGTVLKRFNSAFDFQSHVTTSLEAIGAV